MSDPGQQAGAAGLLATVTGALAALAATDMTTLTGDELAEAPRPGPALRARRR